MYIYIIISFNHKVSLCIHTAKTIFKKKPEK